MNKMAKNCIFVKNTQYGGARCKLNNGFFKLLFLFIFLNLLSFASFGEVNCSLDENGKLTVSGTGKLLQINIENSGTDMNKITEVEIKDGVTSIGDYAFSICSNLTKITIPASVTQIDDGAFSNRINLKTVTFENGDSGEAPKLETIGNRAFSSCSNLTTITIPTGVTSIGDDAFSGCSSLTSIIIPVGVTSVKSGTFSDCSKLTTITIPTGVISIGDNAFSGCSNLTAVTFEGASKLQQIGKSAFYCCSNLTAIKIPVGVTSIESNAFLGCNSLNKIEVADGNNNYSVKNGVLFKIDETKKTVDLIFCERSVTTVTIPAGVTNIWNGAFNSCTKLTKIQVEAGNEKYIVNDEVLFEINDDGLYLICYPAGKLKPAGKLETEYTIPDAIEWMIGEEKVSKNVTKVKGDAFNSCTHLEKITIGKNVTEISDDENFFKNAFSDCTSLASIEVVSGNEKYIVNDGVLFEVNSWGELCLKCYPAGKTETEYTIPNTIDGKNVEINNARAFSGCTNLAKIQVEAGNERYEAIDGVLIDKGYGGGGKILYYPAARGEKNEKDKFCIYTTYEIPEGITEVAEHAFINSKLISIMVPKRCRYVMLDGSLGGDYIKCLYYKFSVGYSEKGSSISKYYLGKELTLKKRWVGDTYNEGRYRGVPKFTLLKHYEDQPDVELDEYLPNYYNGSKEIFYMTSCTFVDEEDGQQNVFDEYGKITEAAKKVATWEYKFLTFIEYSDSSMKYLIGEDPLAGYTSTADYKKQEKEEEQEGEKQEKEEQEES